VTAAGAGARSRNSGNAFKKLLRLFFNPREIHPTLDCAATIDARESHWETRQEFQMRRLIAKFLTDQSGATAIEYCLIAAGISIVIVVAVNGIGSQLNTTYGSVKSSLQ
jgi:pilus assembly protein Flp/PilA